MKVFRYFGFVLFLVATQFSAQLTAPSANAWDCRAPFRLSRLVKRAQGRVGATPERLESLVALSVESLKDGRRRKVDRVSLDGNIKSPRFKFNAMPRFLKGLGNEITIFGTPYYEVTDGTWWIDIESSGERSKPILERVPVTSLFKAVGAEWIRSRLFVGQYVVLPYRPQFRVEPGEVYTSLEILEVIELKKDSLVLRSLSGAVASVSFRDVFFWNHWVSVEERKLMKSFVSRGGRGTAIYAAPLDPEMPESAGIYISVEQLPVIKDRLIESGLKEMMKEGVKVVMTTDSRSFRGAALTKANIMSQRVHRAQLFRQDPLATLVLTPDLSRRVVIHEVKHLIDFMPGGFVSQFFEQHAPVLLAAGAKDAEIHIILAYIMEQRAYSEHYFYVMEKEFNHPRKDAINFCVTHPALSKEIETDRIDFVKIYGVPFFRLLERWNSESPRLAQLLMEAVEDGQENLPLFTFAEIQNRYWALPRKIRDREVPPPFENAPLLRQSLRYLREMTPH